eukprot:820233-Alexandrium_andersonii.AAC.1
MSNGSSRRSTRVPLHLGRCPRERIRAMSGSGERAGANPQSPDPPANGWMMLAPGLARGGR